MVDTPTLPSKRDVTRQLLLRGPVLLHLDPRIEGTRVPSWLEAQGHLVLEVGLDLAVPIPDLRVHDEGAEGTLVFGDISHFCEMPWRAVFAVLGADGKGMVWPEDVPPEVAKELEREALRLNPNLDSKGATTFPERPSLAPPGEVIALPFARENERRSGVLKEVPAELPHDDAQDARPAPTTPSLEMPHQKMPAADPREHTREADAQQPEGSRPKLIPPERSKQAKPLPSYLRVVK